jgi:hypothetical protein
VRHEEVGGEKGLRTNTAVIRTLGTWETSFGPTVWLIVGIKEGVLLLEAEPWFVFLDGVHHLLCMVTVVSPVRSTIVVVGLGEDEDVVATTEGIPEDRGWAKVDIGIVAWCLVRGRPIEVPDAEAANVLDLLSDGLGWTGPSVDISKEKSHETPQRKREDTRQSAPAFRNEPGVRRHGAKGWLEGFKQRPVDLPSSCSGDHHRHRPKRLWNSVSIERSREQFGGGEQRRPTLRLDLAALVKLKVALEELGLV